MEIFHHNGKCAGGKIIVDVSSSIKLVSPSFGIGGDGITPAVLDVIQIPGKKETSVVFYCSSCQQTIKSNHEDEIYADCVVCGKRVSVEDLKVDEYLAGVCTECIEDATSDSPKNSRVRRILEFYPEGAFKKAKITVSSVLFTLKY